MLAVPVAPAGHCLGINLRRFACDGLIQHTARAVVALQTHQCLLHLLKGVSLPCRPTGGSIARLSA